MEVLAKASGRAEREVFWIINEVTYNLKPTNLKPTNLKPTNVF